MQARAETPWRLDHIFLPLTLLLGFMAAIAEAARSPDWRMVVQG